MPALNPKPRPFRPLIVLALLIAFATLPLSAAVELLAEDCDDECCDESTSVCGCIMCPPSMVIIEIGHPDQAVLPVLLSRSSSDSFLELEQEWFDGIDRPPKS